MMIRNEAREISAQHRAINNVYVVDSNEDKQLLFEYVGNKYVYSFYKNTETPMPHIDTIVDAINKSFNTSIRLNTRLQEVLIPRRYAYFLLYRVYKHGSLNSIGQSIVKRNHASVLNQVRHIENALDICDRIVIADLAGICKSTGIHFEVKKILSKNIVKEV